MLRGRLLGTAPGIPTLGKAHSSLWFNVQDKNILFDCGEGTSQQLLKYHLDGEVIDVIVITHYHPDHICGIFMVLQMLYLQKRSKPLTIFLPERIDDFINTCNLFYLFLPRLTYQIEIKEITTLNSLFPSIYPLNNDHLSGYKEYIIEHQLVNEMKCWSILIRDNDFSLLYSSDFNTGLSNSIEEDIDYLIVDALHPPIEEICKLVEKTGKEVILNHGMSEELMRVLMSKQKTDSCLKKHDKLAFIIPEDGHPLEI